MRFPTDLATCRSGIGELLCRPELKIQDVLGGTEDSGICACGDYDGAAYYACVHNSRTGSARSNFVVEFTAPLEEVVIDARDLLYLAFQFWVGADEEKYRKHLELVSRAYGPWIKRYFSAARASQPERRDGLCALATIDPSGLVPHARNKLVLQGRYGVTFRSAFIVQGPVAPERVIAVHTPQKWNPPSSDVLHTDGCLRPWQPV